MADREKVIKATELLDDYFNEYREVYHISPHEAWEIIKDTLKEQEPLEPIVDSFLNRRCPKCNAVLKGKFCFECGQEVKWDGSD